MRKTWNRRWFVGLLLVLAGCGLGPCDCGESKGRPGEPAASGAQGEPGQADRHPLRYQPGAGLEHTTHMVYELHVPGHGVLRTSLSMDVKRTEQSGDATTTEQVLTHYLSLSDGEPIGLPDMVGMKYREVRRRDASFVSEPAVEGGAIPPALSHALIEYIKLATLLEYPDRSLAVGESWTLPARDIEPAPGVRASLRPTFTLTSIDRSEGTPIAEIDSEMEVDITPAPVAPGVVSKGSGTAAAHFRVRLLDGVLLEATEQLKLTSEVTADDGAVIGFQEFPGSIHMWVESGDTATDPSAHPRQVQARPDDASCVLALSSMAQRTAHMPRGEPMVFGAALARVELASASGGAELDVAGGSLVAYADGSFMLDERPLAETQLQAALADWAARAIDKPRLYVYAHGALDWPALQQRLRPVASKGELVLVVRDPDAKPMLPNPPAWFTTRALHAIAAPTLDMRAAAIHELVRVSLGICPPAMVAYQGAITARAGWQGVAEQLPGVFTRCGCESTDLVALESAMYALGGTPDLRFVPVPPRAQTGTVAEVLAALHPPAAAPKAEAAPAKAEAVPAKPAAASAKVEAKP